MTGKTANVSRSTLRICAVGGSVDASCDSRAWTNCSDCRMSTFQSKKRLISDAPRAVFDLMRTMPGNAVHRFFDRTRNGNQRLRRRHYVVINDDDDARKICLREKSRPAIARRRKAQQRKQRDDHQNSARLIGDEPGEFQSAFR